MSAFIKIDDWSVQSHAKQTCVCLCMCVFGCVPVLLSHRCAVLHHGVVELVALGCAPREEAALTHVVVEMLQTAIPREMRDERG